MSDWDRVDAEMAAVIGERPTEYDSATRQNLSELLLFVRESGRPAPVLSAGYWPTFCVHWTVEGFETFEIEVFQDRYEVYRGFDGKVDIRYDYHKPGEPISSALIAELPSRT